jgi:hypothetical protein
MLVCGMECHAQTNIYSLSVHTKWAIGSYPFRFGLEAYRRDSAGYYILADSGKSVGNGLVTGKGKDYTSVILGPIGFTVPLPPFPVAVFGIGVLSAAVFAVVMALRRVRRREEIARPNVSS